MPAAFRSAPRIPRARRRTAFALPLVVAAAALGACHAGRIRDEIGQQLRAFGGRLRGSSPRERYAADLRRRDGDGPALERAWNAAADRALAAPAAAPLPLRERGAFAGEGPTAAAWLVRPRQGERVTVRVDAHVDVAPADSGVHLFSEVWREDAQDPTRRDLVASSDTAHATFDVLADDPHATYVLRVQPALGSRLRWTVALDVGPSLAFPVLGKTVRAVESGFGVARDGGARSHEGVDIMAKRGTPAIAAVDGVVQYVGDDRLGGHVVSVGVPERGMSLYYAHLDRQAVRTGQIVHTGDTVGFVGNTGNAAGGPTHLHFGIYRNEGAVDPMPFLDDRVRPARTAGRDTRSG